MGAPAAETILLTVDIKTNEKQLANLSAQLKQAKADMDALTKANAAGKLSNADLELATVRYNQQVSNIINEVKVLTNANNQQIAINKAAAGSVDQLKAKAALLTTQYNSLSTAERTNTEAGKALTAELLETNEALKAAGAKVGDNRRGVGAYKDAIVDAAKETGLFGGVTDKLTGLQQKYAAAQKLTTFVTGETVGVTKALRIAFIAIPLFAVIGLLGTLYTFLTSTQKGMDFVERKTAAVGAAFNVLLRIVTPVGEALLRLFTDPKQALSDLGDFLQNNIANRFKAFGVIIDAIRSRNFTKLNDGIIQLGTGITDGTAKAKALITEIGNTATAQEKLTSETQRIRAAEEALNVERDRSRAKIEGLKKLSDDSTKSVGIRANAAKEAAAIENGLLAKQIKLQQDKANNLAAEQKLKGNITNEDKKALNDLLREQSTTTQESLTLQTELQNKINALGVEAAAQAAKRRQDAIKAEHVVLAQQLLNVQEGSAAELVLLQRKVDLAAKLTLASETQTANERRLLLATAEADKQKLQADFNAKEIEKAKNHTAAVAAEAQREYIEAQELLENYLDAKRAAIERDYAAGITSENEYQKQLNAVEKAALEAQKVINDDYRKDNAAADRKAADLEIREGNRKKAEKKRLKDAEQDITEAGLQASMAASDAIITAFGAESEAGEAAVVAKKGFALIEIGINLEKQLSAIAVAGAALAASAPPASIPLGAAYIATNDILAYAQAALGAATVLAFNKGGVVPGVGDTDTVPAMLTPGEVVMTKQASQTYAPLLSHLNALSGGAAFHYAAGGIAGQRASSIDGGLVARSLGKDFGIDYNALAAALSKQPIYAIPSEFAAAEARRLRPRQMSTLGSR